MAIGDAVGDFLGTATEARQPSSGVEEMIAFISKQSTTDTVRMYNGSASRNLLAAGNVTDDASSAGFKKMAKISCLITNTNYIQKFGTSDQIFISGVQTNT